MEHILSNFLTNERMTLLKMNKSKKKVYKFVRSEAKISVIFKKWHLCTKLSKR